jgi:predicted Zn-dependent peptidase
MFDFISRNYNTDQMVFCSAGNIPESKIIRLFRKYFEWVPPNRREHKDQYAWVYNASNVTKRMETYQNHCIIGNVAYNIRDDKRLGMFLLNNILGGQGMNSRLNMSLREKNGLAYNVESTYNPYYDTGVFSVYFGTDSNHLDKSIRVTLSELDRLMSKPLGSIQLNKAKNQMKGYMARSFENHESLMLGLGKSLVVFNRIETPDETNVKIDSITSLELMETANEIFDHSKLTTLIYI